MGVLTDIYRLPLGLLIDLYELTMAYGYWKTGTWTKEAVFHLHFRKPPFGSGFSVACGLAPAIEFVESFRFSEEDLDYLSGLTGSDGSPLFEREFLDVLRHLELSCDIDAIPEGTVVFPHEPLVRVRGPILQAQLLETALLNLVNFQTLIATKAARVCLAAQGEPVIDFGLRRAQGIDGGLAASRAAYAGGCAGTSNVLAGKLYGIPVKGTHAHSWVLSFDNELHAFDAWAAAMPNNSVFLVDTYNSLDGVRHAAEVGRRLRGRGHEMAGVRLDSGDLAYLSVEARKILDAAGFPDAQIMASSELDEHLIESLKLQGAKITVWGVGTRLVTAHDDPALGGVYKLTAVREPEGPWEYKVKLSEQAVKITTPGIQQVRRFSSDGLFMADMIFDEELGAPPAPTIVDPADLTRRRAIPQGTPWEDLLVPVFRGGKRIYDPPPLAEVRRRGIEQLSRLHTGIKRFANPHQYPVGLELKLFDLKVRLILEARERSPS
ncbi:MAG TPA: nicotinate phosphoribosyltransferase [Thermoanaerobaculia bacterium]|jgi:nicotinate phosphoribosyltransferase|nr:nicotinate phosphoribosyltransferase [Thermoanaerobaculia bacterium]